MQDQREESNDLKFLVVSFSGETESLVIKTIGYLQ